MPPRASGARRATARRRLVAACACAAAVALDVGLSACGGTASDAVVVRVGDVAITKATVDHWARVIEHGGPAGGFRGRPSHGSPRERALDLLISSNWLIGEAKRQGLAIAGPALEEPLAEREQQPGFRTELSSTGQTFADVKLELSAELAGEAIREALASRAAEIAPRQVVAYYRAHPSTFSTLEVRDTELVENLPTKRAAAELVKRIGTGRRFATLAYHEHVSRNAGMLETPEKVKVVNAIFAARLGVVSEPMLLNGSWAVFVVRRTTPPRLEPFAKERANATRDLDVERQHELATSFSREYEARWRALTSCKDGFVGPGCPQDRTQLGAYEDPFSRRAHPLLSENTAA